MTDESNRTNNLIFNGTIVAACGGLEIAIRIGIDIALGKLCKLRKRNQSST